MKKLFIAGHKGMVGSAILRNCTEYHPITISKSDLDLRNQQEVDHFFNTTKPEYVVVCAAKVGGICANNTYSAEFLYDNLMIQTNIINSSYKYKVNRLLFLGSTCVYPKLAPQPIKEEYLLTGLLEPTNEAYAIAKIAGIKMCEHYRKQYNVLYHSAMPTNLYGVNDNYHPDNSHVIPGLIHKLHQAKLRGDSEYQIWGSGSPLREFLFVDDLAQVCYKLLGLTDPPNLVNIGSSIEVSILELAKQISSIVEFKGKIKTGNPALDGTPRKKTDLTLLHSLIKYKETPLKEGLQIVYKDYLSKQL
jgi:GDP-L-fucose synthase